MIRRVDRGVLAGAGEALGRWRNTDRELHDAAIISAEHVLRHDCNMSELLRDLVEGYLGIEWKEVRGA